MSVETALERRFEAAAAEGLRRVRPPKADARFATSEMLDLAEAAVARIDLWGIRGVTGVSAEQIAAMACVLALTDGVGSLRARMAAPVTETTKKEAS